MKIERGVRRALILIALVALGTGLVAWRLGRSTEASWIWALGIVPVAVGLLISIIRDVVRGRVGVDAIAFVSMAAALVLGETLAGVVVSVMYAGGNVLEDFAVVRAERDLKSLVDRAPRIAHRMGANGVEDVAIDRVTVGNAIMVRGGEVTPAIAPRPIMN